MIILGIETSCDETAIGVLDVTTSQRKINIKPLADKVASQIAIHRPFGGVVPMLASREHLENIKIVLREALTQSFGSLKEIHKIDAIAVTRGPGLIPALLIGTNFARALSYVYKKPLIGVNHMEGHLLSFLLPPEGNNVSLSESDLSKIFPALALLVSGGHTQLIYITKIGDYKIIGDTRDDAAGECFDKGARILGLAYPGGPAISAEARKFIKNKKVSPNRLEDNIKIQLPRPMLNSGDYDFSFSGLKTALLYLKKNLGEKQTSLHRSQLAFELQEAITDVLVVKTIKASQEFHPKSIIVGGGVSANQRLREKLSQAFVKHNLSQKLLFPALEYTGDNAIMIALAGFFRYQLYPNRKWSWSELQTEANYQLDDLN